MSAIQSLGELIASTQVSPAEIESRTRTIRANVLGRSRYLDGENFTLIHPGDLELLFDEYDRLFFGAAVRPALGSDDIRFRLSRRMTRTGGTATRMRRLDAPHSRWYEIAVSTTLLYQSFEDDTRPVRVNGLPCSTRLEALQRIVEHEIIHVIELHLWNESKCSAQRFQSIAGRFFGHTDHRHHLITSQEVARTQYGLRPGSRVRFQFEGRVYEGVVNRITRRASVLVPDPAGQLFTDGQRYSTYYIPLAMLQAVDGDARSKNQV